jgi:cellulose synthase/poly-beta-1,6-N-acetylglucosamine synthase-like glycosyltransferase
MSTSLDAPSEQPERRRAVSLARRGALDLDIVIPVHNEQLTLERSIRRLHAFLSAETRFGWRIVIVDNASTDATPEITRALAGELPHVTSLRLEDKGRGRALRAAWSASDAIVSTALTDLRGVARLVRDRHSGGAVARPRASSSVARTGSVEAGR